MADYEASKPAVPPFVDELIADLVIDIDRSKLPAEFNWEQKCLARRSYPAAHRIVGVILAAAKKKKTEIKV